jgi:hypothetical protein
MTKDQVKAVLDRVLTWPPERQEDVAAFLMSVEAQDKSDYRLSDAQLAELRRRRAEKNPETLSLGKFDERLRRRLMKIVVRKRADEDLDHIFEWIAKDNPRGSAKPIAGEMETLNDGSRRARPILHVLC